jgi:hypothetical protein
MSDLQHYTQGSLLPIEMATEHQYLGMTSSHMNTLSDSSGIVGLWNCHERAGDFGFPRNPIDIIPQSRPTMPDETSHISHSSLASEQYSPPLEFDLNSLAPAPKARKVARHRPIVARPNAPLQNVTGGMELNNTSRQGSKKRGRTGPLPPQGKEDASSMRKRMACAPCFVNNVKVSNSACYPRVCLTILRSALQEIYAIDV